MRKFFTKQAMIYDSNLTCFDTVSYTYDNDNITKKETAATRAGKAYDYSIVNEYDDEGRITATGYSYVTEYFTYDGDGQLTRVDNGTNADRYTAAYSYDSRGNVTSKKVYDYTRNETITSAPKETTTFTYANTGWKDQLVAVNDVELTYDANGNVLTYGDKEFTWNTGRNLESITDGTNTYSYTYDESGIRTSKTVNGVTTYYNTKDGVIQSQTDGTDTWYFQYDTNGTPLGFIRNGVQYFYFTNQMGDVLSIADANGDELVEYEYDEWGNTIDIIPTDSNSEEQLALANANPLRYRGYYLDSETGYYYLQSRYYDPSICRFINADTADIAQDYKAVVNGINLYLYCLNSPTDSFDINGHVTIKLKNKKISNVIVKFARKLNGTWTISSKVKSKKKFKVSKLGVTIYIGASASTSLSAMKNNISSNKSQVKVSSNCSLSFGKRKLTFSGSRTYKNNTVKGTVALGSNSLCYGISVIAKYYYSSRAACYFSIDFGFGIKHITTATATAVVAAICVAVPYIAPAVTKAYCSVLASVASSKAFISSLATIAGAGITVASKFA